MKYMLVCLALLVLAGCGEAPQQAVDTMDDVAEDIVEQAEQIEDQVMQDQEDVIVTDDVEVDVVNDTVMVDINESVVDEQAAEMMGTASFDQWCVPGETFTYADEDVDYGATLIGVEFYKDGDYCKGEATQSMQTPMGPIDITTTYYISEDQTEFWVISDTMGQVTETKVTI